MKKHLIAAAVAGALAVPAMAQVTLSGYLEAGYESVDHKTAASEFEGFTGANMFGSNRIVISGSEDLGGGLKAGFRMEAGLNIASGAMGGNSNNQAASTTPMFDRGAEVNLSGAFGTIAIGKLDHKGIEDNDASVVGNISLFGGSVEAGGAAADANGSIRYTSPEMSGFSVNVSYAPEDNGATALAKSAHGGITAYQLTGKIGAANIKLGGGTVKSATAGTGDTKVMGLGLTYDLGMAQVSFSMQQQDNPGTTADADEMILSVKVPLSGGLDVRANYSQVDVDGASASDRDLYTVAVVKALSKRTNAYVYYQDTGFDLAATAATSDTSKFGLRVSHSF